MEKVFLIDRVNKEGERVWERADRGGRECRRERR